MFAKIVFVCALYFNCIGKCMNVTVRNNDIVQLTYFHVGHQTEHERSLKK